MSVLSWVCASLLAADAPAASTENLISLDELRRLVLERQAAVKTVSIRYRHLHKQYDPKITRNELDGLEDEVLTWCRSGVREKVTHEPWTRAPDQEAPVPRWLSFDGSTGYDVQWWLNGKGVQLIVRTSDRPRLLVSDAPKGIIGQAVVQTGTTLEDMLQSPAVRLTGTKKRGGQICQEVDLGLETQEPLGVNRGTALFDIEHGALLHSLSIYPVGQPVFDPVTKTTKSPRGSKYYSYSILEVQEVSNPLTGKSEWWPRDISHSKDNRIWTVYEEIVLNQPIDDAEFVPEFPVGAEVSDRTINGREVSSYIVGGQKGADTHLAVIRTMPTVTPSLPPPLPATVPAKPTAVRASVFDSNGLIVGAVFALGVVAWFFLKSNG